MVGAYGTDAVPSEGGTGWLLRAVPLPALPKGLVDPKPLVVPEPPCPNKGAELVDAPKAGFAAPPKLKPELLVLPPKPLLGAVLPNPPPDAPKPPVFAFELPNRPPPPEVLAVVDPKGLDAGLLPKREPAAAVLLPKTVRGGVSGSVFISS